MAQIPDAEMLTAASSRLRPRSGRRAGPPGRVQPVHPPRGPAPGRPGTGASFSPGSGRLPAAVDGAQGSAAFCGELALAALGGSCAAPGRACRQGSLLACAHALNAGTGSRRLPATRVAIAVFAFDNDRFGARELADELLDCSPDLGKRSRSLHGQGRNRIGPTNVDAMLLEDLPHYQGVPVTSALDIPANIYHPTP